LPSAKKLAMLMTISIPHFLSLCIFRSLCW